MADTVNPPVEAPEDSPSPNPQRRVRLPWTLLVLLILVNLVNYLDRQIIFPLYEVFKEEFQLTDLRLGLIGTVFMVVHSLASLPFGLLADRWSRKKIIGWGVLFWSGATALTGLAGSFRGLLVARSLVGIGESAYAPAGTAMLSDAFPSSLRARVQSLFTLGMFVGGIAGMMLSGVLAESVGWRPAFFIVAAPGAVLAMFCFQVREPKRTPQTHSGNVWGLLKSPTYVLNLIAAALITFSASAFVTWTAAFSIRYHGFSIKSAGVSLGLTTLVGGLLGVLFGGWLADLLHKRFPSGRALCIAVGFLLSSPLLWWAVRSDSRRGFLVAIVLAAFFLTWYHGPATALVHDLAPPRLRAAAFGLYMLFIHLVGNATAPTVVGALADRVGLRAAMLLPVATTFLSALGFLTVGYLIGKGKEAARGDSGP